MMSRSAVVCVLVLALAGTAVCQARPGAPEQQMQDFSLSGFGEKGKKTWAVFGKSADISSEVIKLRDIQSTLYGDTETVKITAATGDFNRARGFLRLKKNVVVTTASGAQLLTDSLDWDGKAQEVSTLDAVDIRKEGVRITGRGARGLQDLRSVDILREVKALIPMDAPPSEARQMQITCDGPLEFDYTHNVAVFKDNVRVETPDGIMESDLMEAYLVPSEERGPAQDAAPGPAGSSIRTIVARGNVTVTQGENLSHSEKAVYTQAERKITLIGKPEIVFYPSEEPRAPAGN